MVKKRKKILYHSDFSLLKTGFGRVAKLLLPYLYKTGKYEIVHLCCGAPESSAAFEKVPWKCIGVINNDPVIAERISKDPKMSQMAGYGALVTDKVVKDEKPDVYIGVQDIWGVDFSISKDWFPKINHLIWTTLDSLPILPTAVEAAKKVKNYWIWSDFATKALNKMGYKHVKTVHGPLDEDKFYRLKDKERKSLRGRFNIPEGAFVVGFVFRNQLRKSVPNIIEGFKKFVDKHPKENIYLLLHTHWGEGWNIYKLADEYKLDKGSIITTYFCEACGGYQVRPHNGERTKDCTACGEEKALVTTSVSSGISEYQLNEVYNLMDVYCHPFTSGGQEIPIQEAKLTELVTLVTDYSCGEEMCYPEANSLRLGWHEYREAGTEFIKASTDPKSICENLDRVYKMSPERRLEKGKKARQWVIDNFSINKIGKAFEDFIDSCEPTDESIYELIDNKKDYLAVIDPNLSTGEWLDELYKNVLGSEGDDQGKSYWAGEISKGRSRSDVEAYFRQVAYKEISENQDIKDFIDEDDKGKRILYVVPESAGDVYMATSLFDSLKKAYPNYNLYVATNPQYFDILDGNPNIHKVIPYFNAMDNLLEMEGRGDHEGYFEVALLPHINVQRQLTYTHNAKDKIMFKLV